MELERWNPWEDFFSIQKEVNEIFNTFFEKVSFSLPGPPVSFSPLLDIYESEQDTVLRVSLPGVIQEDIDITLEGKKLIIRGVRDKPTDIREGGEIHKEWRYGRFERQVFLPQEPSEENFRASYEGGILEIRFPRADEEEGK